MLPAYTPSTPPAAAPQDAREKTVILTVFRTDLAEMRASAWTMLDQVMASVHQQPSLDYDGASTDSAVAYQLTALVVELSKTLDLLAVGPGPEAAA